MVADMVDLVWLLGGAISMGFFAYGGYLAVACLNPAEQERLTSFRLGRRFRRPVLAQGIQAGARMLEGEAGG